VRSHLSVVQTLCKTYIEVKYLVLHGNIQFKRIGIVVGEWFSVFGFEFRRDYSRHREHDCPNLPL